MKAKEFPHTHNKFLHPYFEWQNNFCIAAWFEWPSKGHREAIVQGMKFKLRQKRGKLEKVNTISFLKTKKLKK